MPSRARTLVLVTAAGAAGLAAGAVNVALGGGRDGDGRGGRVAVARMIDADGRRLGRVVFRPAPGHILVSGRLRGVAPGFHGFHVHAVGACDPDTRDAAGQPAPFASAGGHVNRSNTIHRDHTGDMPPLLVKADGTAFAEFETDRFRVRSLLDADGSAVIVHVGPDNLANIPLRYRSAASSAPGPDAATLQTGDSGGRFACGVIRRR